MTCVTSALPACDRAELLERRVGAGGDDRASVVLPVPGGPCRIIENGRPCSIATRSDEPSPSTCSWPTSSASVRGRMRARQRRVDGRSGAAARRSGVGRRRRRTAGRTLPPGSQPRRRATRRADGRGPLRSCAWPSRTAPSSCCAGSSATAPSTRRATSARCRRSWPRSCATPASRSSCAAARRSARTSSRGCAAPPTARCSGCSRTSTPSWPTRPSGSATRGRATSSTARSGAAARRT